jgi:hypothetical protein
MNAIGFNERDYHVTGVARWDDGREHHLNGFVPESIVFPHTTVRQLCRQMSGCKIRRQLGNISDYGRLLSLCLLFRKVRVSSAEHPVNPPCINRIKSVQSRQLHEGGVIRGREAELGPAVRERVGPASFFRTCTPRPSGHSRCVEVRKGPEGAYL